MSANDELQAHTCEKVVEFYGNVANEKVQDLTEAWKKGELKDGCYYVKLKRPDMFYMLSWEDNHWYEFGWDCWFFDDDIAEILAPIPSYTELQSMDEVVNQAMAANIKLVEQNKQLKELLKECYQEISEYLDNDSRLMCILGEMFKNGR